MATLADSLKTSSGRPLALRKRPDLSSQEQRYQGLTYWVVKEPVGLKYFRFQEEEYAILQMLDGHASLDDIKQAFERRFAPQKITLTELQQFIGNLHRNGLVVSNSSGQGWQLHQRRGERKHKERMATWTNILAIRFKGIDPEWLLNRIYPFVKWFFTPAAMMFCCLLALSALSLIVVQFNVFQSRLPAFNEFFGPGNWLWLGVTLAVTKVLHEFGHGLSCKHFGGECHEMGVMFLVLTPCLYCNVSDSWMLPNKWKRAAIGAAGIYVEVVLASIATFIWWFSEQGMLNHLALRVMFICSVSTIVFNANPLLRYDGYYILSDIAEIPNLRQKATSILNRMMAQKCLGLELPEEPFLPQRNQIFFALYTIAAVAYRWFVLIMILWFLYKVFEPYGLQVIGQTIAAFSIGGLIVKPLWQLGKFLRVPGRMEQVKRPNLYATVGVILLIVMGVMLIPLPRRVACTLEIRARDAESVYVDVPGRLDEVLVRPGDKVDARPDGPPLARLSNLDLELKMAELTGQQKEYEAQLSNLRRQRFDDARAGQEITQIQKTLAAIGEQLADKHKELARLQLRAPVAGTVLPPPRQSENGQQSPGMLRQWKGSPLDPQNLGAYLAQSVLFCEIGDPQRLEAVLVIDQSDIELVRQDQNVEIKLDSFPTRTLTGKIEEIAKVDLKIAPRNLSNQAGGELATRTDTSGVQHPLSTSYTARVPLEDDKGQLQIGLRGRGRIDAGTQPLGGRIWRYLSHTFHFTL